MGPHILLREKLNHVGARGRQGEDLISYIINQEGGRTCVGWESPRDPLERSVTTGKSACYICIYFPKEG